MPDSDRGDEPGEHGARPARGAIRPSHAYVLSGYGTAGALYTQDGERSFFTSVAPIFLFQFTDKVLAEAELEFELEEGATKTGLEYANISILLNDYVTVTAGKFLLPFGVFGQRLHPTWINRFTTNPPVFGGHGGVPGVEGLLPILSDIGVMVGTVLPIGGIGRNLTFSGFVTNGPMAEAMGDGGGMEEEHVPELAFGESVEDNNQNKMIGGRLGLVLAPHFELDLSAMRAAYGEVALPHPDHAVGLRAGEALGRLRPGGVSHRLLGAGLPLQPRRAQ